MNFIPKIEWNEFTVIGTTAVSSPIITAISDTSGTRSGMYISGTGIPLGSKVVSFTATTITINLNATVAGSPTITLVERVTFDLPPDGDNLRKSLSAKTKLTPSTNGTIQAQHDYTEETFKVSFALVTQAVTDLVEDFMLTHALQGKSFKYFEHFDEVDFFTVTLNKLLFKHDRIIADGSGGFIQNFTMDLRRLR